jgi:hypothetical protein
MIKGPTHRVGLFYTLMDRRQSYLSALGKQNCKLGRCLLTLKIIGAGFGRTGTHSLKSAIEILGFGPCHHMYEVRRSAEQIAYWTDAALGAAMDWDKVFAGYNAQVDWPAAYYWEDLAMHFPEAKVILTHRDPEDWYESIKSTILPAAEIGRSQDPDPMGRAGSDISYQIVLQKVFGGRLSDKAHAVRVYTKHLEQVKHVISPDRLLTYDVRDGWDPLCDFLGVDRPDQAFPSGNSTADFRAKKAYLASKS